MPKQTRKRYSDAEKKKILEAARREKLSGAQVKKRFGVSMLTFYRWRGPVRGRRRRGRPAVAPKIAAGALRREVRSNIESILPQIIREEVRAALKELLR